MGCGSRVVLCAALALPACGGGAPLLHPAHTLSPGRVSMGAGMSGRFDVSNDGLSGGESAVEVENAAATTATLQDVAVAPGVAPWVSGRVGITGDNEAGLTYTGRSVRIDGRHAFHTGPLFISAGLGGSVVLPKPRGDGQNQDLGSVNGGGADLPLLLGVVSASDLYALWLGPRAGVELLTGNLAADQPSPIDPNTASEFVELSGTHLYAGGLVGFRVGFRYLHAAIEMAVSYHRVSGDIGPSEVTVDGVSVTPAGALVFSFQ